MLKDKQVIIYCRIGASGSSVVIGSEYQNFFLKHSCNYVTIRWSGTTLGLSCCQKITLNV